MSRIGERLSTTNPRYIRHPPATSQPWGNGRFVDAGLAHIVDNNLSHLSHESCRHLVWALGPGTLAHTPAVLASGWQGLSDSPQVPSSPRDPPIIGISWDRRTAMRFGPFVAVSDRVTSQGVLAPRRVDVAVDVWAATPTPDPSTAPWNGLYLYAALTADPSPPSESALASGVGAGTVAAPRALTIGGNRAVRTISLAVPDDLGATASWRCRHDGTLRGRRTVGVPAYWLWVGWRASLANCAVISISAYETRLTL
jgi:hypothetical protein